MRLWLEAANAREGIKTQASPSAAPGSTTALEAANAREGIKTQ